MGWFLVSAKAFFLSGKAEILNHKAGFRDSGPVWGGSAVGKGRKFQYFSASPFKTKAL